jgi:hypothetical protein
VRYAIRYCDRAEQGCIEPWHFGIISLAIPSEASNAVSQADRSRVEGAFTLDSFQVWLLLYECLGFVRANCESLRLLCS